MKRDSDDDGISPKLAKNEESDDGRSGELRRKPLNPSPDDDVTSGLKLTDLPYDPLGIIFSLLHSDKDGTDLINLRMTSRRLMNCVDSFIRKSPVKFNFTAVVFEKNVTPGKKTTGNRDGFDVIVCTSCSTAVLHNLYDLRSRITERSIEDTDPRKDMNYPFIKGYKIDAGNLSRVTIPIRSLRDPIIPLLSAVIGKATRRVVITRIRNEDDVRIVRLVMKGSRVKELGVIEMDHLNDDVSGQLIPLMNEMAVKEFSLSSLRQVFTLSKPATFVRAVQHLDAACLEARSPNSDEFLGQSHEFWTKLLWSKERNGCKIFIDWTERRMNERWCGVDGSTLCVEWKRKIE